MTRRVKRDKAFDLTLTIHDDGFIRPPRDMQRNSLLNRAMKEFSDELIAIDRQAADFVAGELYDGLATDRTQQALDDVEIMEDWQLPIMQAMADSVAATHGDILEVGFGLGVSASMIQKIGVRSHTIIECNDSVMQRFAQWRADYPDADIRIVHGLWQESMDGLGPFDGIFFHTYPLTDDEYMDYVQKSVTFAEHFFATAAAHLNPGGRFSYFSNEIDSLSRPHQRALLEHFSSFSVTPVALSVPDDVRDTWWSNTMVSVCAYR